MLVERAKLLSKQKGIASTFIKHFRLITGTLNFVNWP